MNPHLLEPDHPPQPLRCCACGQPDATPTQPITARLGVPLATCYACALLATASPGYMRQTQHQAALVAFRVFWAQVAAVAGVSDAAMHDALQAVNHDHSSTSPQHLDAQLGLPPGSIAGALAKATGNGEVSS
jgi:hypothetical protein